MSIEWMTHVWNNSKQSGSQLLMLLAIADYANETGKAWPSIETLAQRTRQTHRNALRIIDKIEKSGELKVELRASDYGTNVYTVQVDTTKKKRRNPKMSHDNLGKNPKMSHDNSGPQMSHDPLLSTIEKEPTKTNDIKAAFSSCVNYPINWAAGSGAAAKWLAENGYTPDDVIGCYKSMAADSWWSDKQITLKNISVKIGAWKSNNTKPVEKELVFS